MSKRAMTITCGILAAIAGLLVICLVLLGGLLVVSKPPQSISQIFVPPTETPVPSPTFTPTATPTIVPPTNTPVPTHTPLPTDTPVPPSPTKETPPTDTPIPQPTETNTPLPTDTTVPTSTPVLPAPTQESPTVAPTSAPAAGPFLPIGTTAELSPQANGATGSAVLFSPRKITMINLNYDGKCPITDIRLGMEGFPKPPVAVLTYLEERPYKNESFPVDIPADLPAGSANAIFVYCDSRDEMLAWGPLLPPAQN